MIIVIIHIGRVISSVRIRCVQSIHYVMPLRYLQWYQKELNIIG